MKNNSCANFIFCFSFGYYNQGLFAYESFFVR